MEARRLTHSTSESLGAYVASTPNGWAIAYSDDGTGDHEIHLARLDLEGRGTPERITYAKQDSMIPAIASQSKTLAFAWNDFRRAESATARESSDIYFLTVSLSAGRNGKRVKSPCEPK